MFIIFFLALNKYIYDFSSNIMEYMCGNITVTSYLIYNGFRVCLDYNYNNKSKGILPGGLFNEITSGYSNKDAQHLSEK